MGQVRGTALEQSYKAHVGGVKMGYSGHVPGGRDHFGSAHVGGSMEEYGTVQQRHHHGEIHSSTTARPAQAHGRLHPLTALVSAHMYIHT